MADDREMAWLTAVALELGVDFDADEQQTPEALAHLTRVVTEKVDASLVPRTLFLVGLAASRAAEPGVAAHDFAGKLETLAEGWDASGERGAPANDQGARA